MTKPPNIPFDPSAPFSQEAEEAVLGAILIDADTYISVAEFLRADDFYLLRHQYIWQAIHKLHERGDGIDHITIAEELENMDVLEQIGGRSYLMQLVTNTGTSVYAQVYGRLVERTAIRRKLMQAADEIKALALDEALNIDSVVKEAESRLFGVTETQIKREFVPMWDALSAYYDRMEYMLQHKDEATGVPTGFRDMDQLLGGFQRSDLLVFAGRPGMGKCVSGDTLVHTEDGMRPIRELLPANQAGMRDDEGGTYYPLVIDVLTPDGIRPTSHFYEAGIHATRKISTRAGYTLAGTLNHPVLTLNHHGEKVWKRLEQIKGGDYVAIHRHQALWGNHVDLPTPNYQSQSQWRNTYRPQLPHQLTPDFAYAIGLLVGDGCVTQKSIVGFTSADESLVIAFRQFAEQMGLSPLHSEKFTGISLYQWLNDIGLQGYAHEKSIPDVITRADETCVRAFLQGLFDTDAHAEAKHGYIQYVTSSAVLAKQVHILLLQFGIVSKLTYKSNDYRGAWLIRITGDHARHFYQRIGFRLARKQAQAEALPVQSNGKLESLSPILSTVAPYQMEKSGVSHLFAEMTHQDRLSKSLPTKRGRDLGWGLQLAEVTDLLEPEYYWDAVENVADSGNQAVYDLVVPDVHSYIANGIVSHNTSWLLTTAMNVARVGGRVAIFTMEMGVEQLIQRMVSMETGINVQKLRLAKLTPQEAARFTEVVGRISNFPIFVDDTPALSPMEMRTKCRRLKHEFGLDLVIVDYMQLMNAGGNYENNRVQEISYISRSLKELARELNVPLISAAQLSRAVEQRQDKRPLLSDLRESGSIEQDADIVMFLYRDEVYNEATEFPNQADVIVAKHRNGPTGVVSLFFEKQLTKFLDASVHRVDLSDLG